MPIGDDAFWERARELGIAEEGVMDKDKVVQKLREELRKAQRELRAAKAASMKEDWKISHWNGKIEGLRLALKIIEES